jgi:NitT/TauT family transport system substrate-binding protein
MQAPFQIYCNIQYILLLLGKEKKSMINRIKNILYILAFMLTAATGANANTLLRVNHMTKYASSVPLLYKITELLPKYAAAEGINDLKIEYVDVLPATIANEMMLAGKIDLIYGGINGFGILFDKDPNLVRLVAGAEEYDQWMVCNNLQIKTLADIKPEHRIAMQGLNSGEHMQLRQYSAAKFGDKEYDKFTSNIIAMPRDQAVAQLTKDKPEIDCAIVGVPWQNIAVSKGAKVVAHVEDTNKTVGVLNVIYSTKKWLDENPKLARAWIAAQKEAIQLWEKNPEPMVKVFMERDEVTSPTLEEILQQKKENKDVYQYKPDSGLKYLDFMYRVGILSGGGKGKTVHDILWDESLVK